MIEEQANPGTMVAYWPLGGGLLQPEGSHGMVKFVTSDGHAMVLWDGFIVAQLVPLADLQVITASDAGAYPE